MMNHGRYSLKSFLMKKSLVIFDEIHAYDSETFGIIKSLIRHLHDQYDAKFCIMSATFPVKGQDNSQFNTKRQTFSIESDKGMQ